MNITKSSTSSIKRGTVEIWKQYEKLLKEAVNTDHYYGLQKLLNNEHLVESIDEFKKRSSKPIIIAIANKNVSLINLMCEHGYKLPEPHPKSCKCDICNGNRFGQIKGQMAALKALCNPVWISVSADDPFETIFKLQSMEEEFERVSGSFEMEFQELFDKNELFLVALLDQIKTESEGLTLMRHKTISENSDSCGMEFVNEAIDHDQKLVIAESEIQYFVHSKINLPHWEHSGNIYKIFITILIAISSPITSLLNILMPSKCCPSISEFAMRPYVKFVNGATSFLTFLGLLVVMGAMERNGIRSSKTPTGVEIAVFIWLCGFLFEEMKEMIKSGIKGYFSQGWNWVDIAMDFFMVFTYVVWFVLYGLMQQTPPGIEEEPYKHTMFLADGTFCVAIVLSFFRLLYLCQASSYLGLMQICLGKMILVIWQFMFVALVNLLGFTVAMVYLFHSSKVGRAGISDLVEEYKDQTSIYSCFKEYFYGFFSTMFTLIYLSLGVLDTDTIENFEDGTLIHLWANLFLIVYIGVSMIILMNMLIAMMSNGYQEIADNIHSEHLFSQTKLWMDYVGDGGRFLIWEMGKSRPVPFNMIPRLQTIIDLVMHLKHRNSSKYKNEMEILQKEEDQKYKTVTRALVKRYLKSEFGCPDFAEPPPVDENIDNDPFIQKIDAMCEEWNSIAKDVSDIKQALPTYEDIENIGYEGDGAFERSVSTTSV